MKCFHDSTADAVATCPQCGKGLCHGCTSRFSPIVCESCCVVGNRKRATEIYVRLTITTVLFVGVTTLLGAQQRVPGIYAPIGGAIVVCLFWGTRLIGPPSTADRINSALHPIAGLFGSLIRLVLAGIFGLFAAPAGIASSIAELARIRRTLHEIEHPVAVDQLSADVSGV